jgi:hypothetical protein
MDDSNATREILFEEGQEALPQALPDQVQEAGHEIAFLVDKLKVHHLMDQMARKLNDGVGAPNWYRGTTSNQALYEIVLRDDTALTWASLNFPADAFGCFGSAGPTSRPAHFEPKRANAPPQKITITLRYFQNGAEYRSDESLPRAHNRVREAIQRVAPATKNICDGPDGAWIIVSRDPDLPGKLMQGAPKDTKMKIIKQVGVGS